MVFFFLFPALFSACGTEILALFLHRSPSLHSIAPNFYRAAMKYP